MFDLIKAKPKFALHIVVEVLIPIQSLVYRSMGTMFSSVDFDKLGDNLAMYQ